MNRRTLSGQTHLNFAIKQYRSQKIDDAVAYKEKFGTIVK